MYAKLHICTFVYTNKQNAAAAIQILMDNTRARNSLTLRARARRTGILLLVRDVPIAAPSVLYALSQQRD